MTTHPSLSSRQALLCFSCLTFPARPRLPLVAPHPGATFFLHSAILAHCAAGHDGRDVITRPEHQRPWCPQPALAPADLPSPDHAGRRQPAWAATKEVPRPHQSWGRSAHGSECHQQPQAGSTSMAFIVPGHKSSLGRRKLHEEPWWRAQTKSLRRYYAPR